MVATLLLGLLDFICDSDSKDELFRQVHMFRVFGLQPTSLMVQLIGLFYFFNFIIGFFIKNDSSETSTIKLLGGIGCISGVVIRGYEMQS